MSVMLYTADLVSKLKTVAAFGGRVAATLGGTEADPTLSQIEVPAAWVVFTGHQSLEQNPQRFQVMRLNFSVVVILAYGRGETDFVNTQLKILEDASQAVRGEISGAVGSFMWQYQGAVLDSLNPDRAVFVMNFFADSAYAKQPN